jgi:hypothetical protein
MKSENNGGGKGKLRPVSLPMLEAVNVEKPRIAIWEARLRV